MSIGPFNERGIVVEGWSVEALRLTMKEGTSWNVRDDRADACRET